MKQEILTGLTLALTFTTVGLVSSTQASQERSLESAPNLEVGSHPTSQVPPATKSGGIELATKVGERQLQGTDAATDANIASIHAHELAGRRAVTLYVRRIPIVTFLGSQQPAEAGVKVAAESSQGATSNQPDDPLWRATTVVSKLNQLHREGMDASKIQVLWHPQRQSYLIRVADQHLLEMNPQTILPQSTRDPAQDALQITNRLRRVIGNAAPLTQIAGQPKPASERKQTLAVGPVRFELRGVASWYGPGFHGNLTASGERFNQYALTAAHQSLPFGTQVRVTNLNNGRAVVVRINDRGPFTGGRVLDLSKGAAQVLGVLGSGLAPVRIEVLQ